MIIYLSSYISWNTDALGWQLGAEASVTDDPG